MTDKFKNILKEEILNETTLNRALNHFKNEEIPVGIITAFRASYTKKENLVRNKTLALKLKEAGYGYVYVDGGWIEKQDDGSKKNVTEDSILVIGNKNDSKKLEKLLIKLVKEYDQDGTLFKPEGTLDVFIMDGKGDKSQIGSDVVLKELEAGYTKLRGNGEKVFAFESIRVAKGVWGGYLDRLNEKK